MQVGPVGQDGVDLVPPVGVAQQLNARFPMNRETNQYFTLLYGLVRISERRLLFTSAGQPPVIVLRADGTAAPIKCPGPPIGFFTNPKYNQIDVTLESGDRVLFYSDGVVEAMNESDAEFGLDRLITSWRLTQSRPLTDSLTALVDQVRDWSGGQPQDDISMIALAVQ